MLVALPVVLAITLAVSVNPGRADDITCEFPNFHPATRVAVTLATSVSYIALLWRLWKVAGRGRTVRLLASSATISIVHSIASIIVNSAQPGNTRHISASLATIDAVTTSLMSLLILHIQRQNQRLDAPRPCTSHRISTEHYVGCTAPPRRASCARLLPDWMRRMSSDIVAVHQLSTLATMVFSLRAKSAPVALITLVTTRWLRLIVELMASSLTVRFWCPTRHSRTSRTTNGTSVPTVSAARTATSRCGYMQVELSTSLSAGITETVDTIDMTATAATSMRTPPLDTNMSSRERMTIANTYHKIIVA
eukprot:TRINITY_DN12730_c0_g1_i2.p1 TRINITY_DN12730_c0_g1~~TRINITY_DN12730_c0_g1_i2.p1  ORF type:complete len:341 (-),score=75.16 TRINITY_DN12730_c0_g1_i2:701-1624(-)